MALVVSALLLCAPAARGQQAGGAAPPAPPAAAPASAPAAVPAAAASPASTPPANTTVGSQTEPVAPTSGVVTEGLPAHVAEPKIMRELSPWSMFLEADVLVKAVMIGLLVASLVTWTIFLGKTVELALARRKLIRALHRLSAATTMSEAKLALGAKDGLLSALLAAAGSEIDISGPGASDSGIKERGESRMMDLVRAETQTARRGMGVLATIGSTAPFVGLFGTVWGIMNSFIGISKAQTTNLAVVAPGIAEALLATAVGLFAAIPAVIIYNHFARATRSYQMLVSRASSASGRLLSRELDRRRSGGSSRAAK